MYDYRSKLLDAGIEIVPVEPYVNMKTKILHKCKNGHTWSVKPTHILHSKSGCPYCSGNVKITTASHAEEVFPLTFSGEYKNRHSKLEYTCQEGHKWITTPHSIINGKTGCPVCAGTYSYSAEEYRNKLVNREILVLEDYKKGLIPILHQCMVCEATWKASPSNVMSGTGCPSCGGTKKKSQEEYNKEIFQLGMSALEPYVNNKTPILHECIANKHKIYTTPSNLLTRGGCTFCHYSGPGTLYYLKIFNNENTYYKLGITSKSIPSRIKNMSIRKDFEVEVLKSVEFSSIEEARYIEQILFKDLAQFRITVDFVSNGNTEFFSKDIMEYVNART